MMLCQIQNTKEIVEMLCLKLLAPRKVLYESYSMTIGLGRLHRRWCKMLETKCVGDNFKMLVTIWAISVTNIIYLLTLALGTDTQKMLPKILILSTTFLNCRQL